jgi:hypothetical protein
MASSSIKPELSENRDLPFDAAPADDGELVRENRFLILLISPNIIEAP